MMNRQFALILLIGLATTAFGQRLWVGDVETSEINPRLQQLEDCLQKLGYEISYSQGNMSMIGTDVDRSITRGWTFELSARGEEITNRLVYRVPDSIVPLRRQLLAIAIDSIRAAFADLNKKEVETYMYEKHKDCADTIEYSIGFYDGKGNLQPSNTNNSVFFHNAKEQASFSYHKNCDDWDIGNYKHRYKSDDLVSVRSFDAAAFEKHIQPAFAVLKSLKGAATYPVYWRHDKEYKDSIGGGRIQRILGINHVNANHAGLVTGSHYFIPAQYKAEANALYRQLDSLTFDYLNRHPEQLHSYHTSSALPYPSAPQSEYTTYTEASSNSVQHFSSASLLAYGYGYDIDNYDYILNFYLMEDGLHILSITSTGEGWMPAEWEKLKSWINGKKKYLKGA